MDSRRPAGGLRGHAGPPHLRSRRLRPGVHAAHHRQCAQRYHRRRDPVELLPGLRGGDVRGPRVLDHGVQHHGRNRWRRGRPASPPGVRALGPHDVAEALQPTAPRPQRLRGVRHRQGPPPLGHRLDRLGYPARRGTGAEGRRRRDRARGVGLAAHHGRLGRNGRCRPVEDIRGHQRLAARDRSRHGAGLARGAGQAPRPGGGSEQPAHTGGVVAPLLVVQAGLRAPARSAHRRRPARLAGVRRRQPQGRRVAQRQAGGRPDVPVRPCRLRRHPAARRER